MSVFDHLPVSFHRNAWKYMPKDNRKVEGFSGKYRNGFLGIQEKIWFCTYRYWDLKKKIYGLVSNQNPRNFNILNYNYLWFGWYLFMCEVQTWFLVSEWWHKREMMGYLGEDDIVLVGIFFQPLNLVIFLP